MIIFRNVRWKNLLSTGNYFTEINLSNTANTLVVGENGSGKSTMLDALCFALFGKPFRDINKPQLLNSLNNQDCVVEVEFDDKLLKVFLIVFHRSILIYKVTIAIDFKLVRFDTTNNLV